VVARGALTTALQAQCGAEEDGRAFWGSETRFGETFSPTIRPYASNRESRLLTCAPIVALKVPPNPTLRPLDGAVVARTSAEDSQRVTRDTLALVLAVYEAAGLG